jgi:thiamine kinase-like enzyme
MLPQILSSIPQLESATLLAELSAGPFHRSWRLASDVGDVVVRVDSPLVAAIGLDRKCEAAALRIAFGSGIGPELIWADPERGVQITRYLPGRSWGSKDLGNPENFARLAKLLSRLHSLPVTGEWPDWLAGLRRYADIVATHPAQQLYAESEGLFLRLEQASAGRRVLCHGDIHAANIVDNGQLRLIDWEYAGVVSPLLDLAAFARQHELNQALLAAFLGAYQPAARKRNLSDFALAYELHDCAVLLWYLALFCLQSDAAPPIAVPPRYQKRLGSLLKSSGISP